MNFTRFGPYTGVKRLRRGMMPASVLNVDCRDPDSPTKTKKNYPSTRRATRVKERFCAGGRRGECDLAESPLTPERERTAGLRQPSLLRSYCPRLANKRVSVWSGRPRVSRRGLVTLVTSKPAKMAVSCSCPRFRIGASGSCRSRVSESATRGVGAQHVACSITCESWSHGAWPRSIRRNP